MNKGNITIVCEILLMNHMYIRYNICKCVWSAAIAMKESFCR